MSASVFNYFDMFRLKQSIIKLRTDFKTTSTFEPCFAHTRCKKIGGKAILMIFGYLSGIQYVFEPPSETQDNPQWFYRERATWTNDEVEILRLWLYFSYKANLQNHDYLSRYLARSLTAIDGKISRLESQGSSFIPINCFRSFTTFALAYHDNLDDIKQSNKDIDPQDALEIKMKSTLTNLDSSLAKLVAQKGKLFKKRASLTSLTNSNEPDSETVEMTDLDVQDTVQSLEMLMNGSIENKYYFHPEGHYSSRSGPASPRKINCFAFDRLVNVVEDQVKNFPSTLYEEELDDDPENIKDSAAIDDENDEDFIPTNMRPRKKKRRKKRKRDPLELQKIDNRVKLPPNKKKKVKRRWTDKESNEMLRLIKSSENISLHELSLKFSRPYASIAARIRLILSKNEMDKNFVALLEQKIVGIKIPRRYVEDTFVGGVKRTRPKRKFPDEWYVKKKLWGIIKRIESEHRRAKAAASAGTSQKAK